MTLKCRKLKRPRTKGAAANHDIYRHHTNRFWSNKKHTANLQVIDTVTSFRNKVTVTLLDIVDRNKSILLLVIKASFTLNIAKIYSYLSRVFWQVHPWRRHKSAELGSSRTKILYLPVSYVSIFLTIFKKIK